MGGMEDEAGAADELASFRTGDGRASGPVNQPVTNVYRVTWVNHGNKHVPQKGMSWKEIVKSTANGGAAKYNPNIGIGMGDIGSKIKELELYVWETGIPISYNNQNYKVKALDFVCGAFEGEEVHYIVVKESAGTIHGHPISEARYKQLLKKVGR